MRRRNYIACIFLALMVSAGAQVPGYLGKRFSLGGQLHLMNAFANPNAGGSMAFEPKYYNSSSPNAKKLGPDQQVFSPDLSMSAMLEYVARRGLVVGFRFDHYATKAYGGTNNLTYQLPDTGFVTSSPLMPASAAIGMFDISANSASLVVKKFFRAYIAPYGKYFRFELMYTKYTATYDPAKFYAEQQFVGNQGQLYYVRVPNVSFGKTKQDFSKVDAFVGMGKQRIYFDHLLVDCGAKISLAGFLGIFSSDNTSTQPASYIHDLSRQRLIAHNAFNLYLGVSWLLF